MKLQFICLFAFISVFPADHEAQDAGVPVQTRDVKRNTRNTEHDESHTLAFTEPTPPRQVEVFMHQSLTLHCEAASVDGPAPVVSWMKDGHLLTTSKHDISDDNGYAPNTVVTTTHSKLFLDCITAHSTGTYTCVAENRFLRVETTTILVISSAGRASRIANVAMAKECKAHAETMQTPSRIVMWSRNTMQTEEFGARLFCQATGNPSPNITWEFQYGRDKQTALKPIGTDERKHIITKNGDLIVEDLKFHDDKGRYICRAKNALGADRAEAFLYPVRAVRASGFK